MIIQHSPYILSKDSRRTVRGWAMLGSAAVGPGPTTGGTGTPGSRTDGALAPALALGPPRSCRPATTSPFASMWYGSHPLSTAAAGAGAAPNLKRCSNGTPAGAGALGPLALQWTGTPGLRTVEALAPAFRAASTTSLSALWSIACRNCCTLENLRPSGSGVSRVIILFGSTGMSVRAQAQPAAGEQAIGTATSCSTLRRQLGH